MSEFYVYHLLDPRTDEVFYVGKGKGRRWRSHEGEARTGRVVNPDKVLRIQAIWDAGFQVVRIKVADGLDEEAAFRLEREEIARLRPSLTNHSSGTYSERDRARVVAARALRHMIPFNDWCRSTSPARRELLGGVDGMYRLYDRFQNYMLEMSRPCPSQENR